MIAVQLRGDAPMQVVSGHIDKPVVHFEAPYRALEPELDAFIAWFNQSKDDTSLDPLLRAAITHLWFVILHPLDDGNGRITRLLTDLALAQADLDITAWLHCFFNHLEATFDGVLTEIDQTVFKTNYWRQIDQTKLTAEQVKVLNRMLDGDFEQGISTIRWRRSVSQPQPVIWRSCV